MKKMTSIELREKADFISGFVNYKIDIKDENDTFFVFFDYGLEGRDCMSAGNISNCNRYLNYLIRKLYISEDWNEFKGRGTM